MKIIECPRDAMQGLEVFVPTEKKIDYINQLLKVGFDTVDFGSFVSPKAIPQLRDTAEVLAGLDLSQTKSKLLAIVANFRGAEDAVKHKEIDYLGFPFSISETFQQRNTNKSIMEALNVLNEIQELCVKNNKELVVYISMGFGNPYGDAYSPEIVAQFTDILASVGIKIISLSDTIVVSNPENIQSIYTTLTKQHPSIEFGAHLHSNPNSAIEKVVAAYDAGCRRFDGAIKGYGGCPMAKDDLVGNLATETMLSVFDEKNVTLQLNREAFNESLLMAAEVFPV
jgi:hydroxymethylglutaryl-CoA lyase